jgi:ELWxxDGT repeat protein
MPPNLLEYPVVFQDALWFFTGDFDGIAPAALWRSDGTAAGTGPVGDLEVYGAFVMRAVGDNLYFVGIDANYSDAEVWATDGTIEGTRRMKDIEPGPGSSGIHEWAAVGDTLFFVASNLEHGPELWKSDGTEAGTRLVRETIPGPYSGFAPRGLRELAGVLVFLGHDGEHGFELWRSDGTEAGTYMIEDRLPGLESSSPSMLATFGNRVAFSVLDDAAGREPCIARASILTRQPKRAVADLAADVRALELPAGLEQGLLAKLSSVESALAKPSGHRVAIRLLEAFAREVEALVPAHLSPGDAEDLRAFAAEIERLLGMDNGSPPSIPRDGGQTLIPDFLRRGVRP